MDYKEKYIKYKKKYILLKNKIIYGGENNFINTENIDYKIKFDSVKEKVPNEIEAIYSGNVSKNNNIIFKIDKPIKGKWRNIKKDEKYYKDEKNNVYRLNKINANYSDDKNINKNLTWIGNKWNKNGEYYDFNEIELNNKIKENLSIIYFNNLNNLNLIVESGGGDIYTTNYNSNVYVYKKLKGSDKNNIINNLLDNGNIFIEMSKFNNLIVPLFIIKQDENIIGYLMKYLNNSEYSSLNIFMNTCNTFEIFIIILYNICIAFENIYSCGAVPCPEHDNNIMVKKDDYTIKIIDLDDIKKCEKNNEIDTIKQFELLFNNIHNDIKKDNNFLKIFKIKTDGDILINTNIKTIIDIKNIITLICNNIGIIL